MAPHILSNRRHHGGATAAGYAPMNNCSHHAGHGNDDNNIVTHEDESSLLHAQLSFEALEERDYYSKRIEELQTTIKDYALNVVEQERLLIRALMAPDVESELSELRLKIQNIDPKEAASAAVSANIKDDDGLDKDSRMFGDWNPFRPKPKRSDLTPQQAFSMAMDSLNSSIEYFEGERELLLSKLAKVTSDKKASRVEAESIMQEMKSHIISLEGELGQMSYENRCTQEQLETTQVALAESTTYAESLDRARAVADKLYKQLEVEYNEYVDKIRRDALQRASEDEEVVATMRMMQDYIEELEVDVQVLTEQCNLNIATLATIEECGKLSDSEKTEAEGQLEELQYDHENLETKYNFQQGKLNALGLENAALKSKNIDLEDEHERLLTQLKAQQEAVQVMNGDESKLKLEIQKLQADHEELQSEFQVLESKYEAQGDSMAALRKESMEATAAALAAAAVSDSSMTEQRYQEQISSLEIKNDDLRREVAEQAERILLLEQAQEIQQEQARVAEEEQAQTIQQLQVTILSLESERESLHEQVESLELSLGTRDVSTPTRSSRKGKSSPSSTSSYTTSPSSSRCDSPTPSLTKAEMMEQMVQLEYVKQKVAIKSVGRESTIAHLEEENELKDAKIAQLEQLVQSLMTEQSGRHKSVVGPRAARWMERLDNWRRGSTTDNGDENGDGAVECGRQPARQAPFNGPACAVPNQALLADPSSIKKTETLPPATTSPAATTATAPLTTPSPPSSSRLLSEPDRGAVLPSITIAAASAISPFSYSATALPGGRDITDEQSSAVHSSAGSTANELSQ